METKKIDIEFYANLGGYSKPFIFQHRGDEQPLPTILEAPFIIYWDGWGGSRKDCNRGTGNVEIVIGNVVDDFNLIRNIYDDKVIDLIVDELKNVPEDKRGQEWVRRVSLDTIKLWQKESK